MTENGKLTITVPALSLSVFVIVAFLLHLVTYASSGLVYCALIAMSSLAFCISKPIVKKSIPSYYVLSWFLLISTLWLNYAMRYRSNTVLIDDVVLTCGFLTILMFSRNLQDYNTAIGAILFMSFIITAGVYLQRFVPEIYRVIIHLFPSRMQSDLSNNNGEVRGIKGFATNVGFTANYIITGIFVLLSRINIKKTRRKIVIQIIILGIALLMTGKRGPVIFSLFSVFLVGFLPIRGTERMKKIWGAFLAVLVFSVFYFAFDSALEQIPVLGRYIESINLFINGEDITSGRSRLYAWAIHLVIRNPIFGIGWGKYRTTVVGNATVVKSLDTHNVYLQLLCETGIIGFLIFVTTFLMSWTMTKNAYCSCLAEDNEELKKWRTPLCFSFIFQTYFLLFSLTGNPLYDQFYQVIYVFSCSIVIAYRYVTSYGRV